MHVAPPEIFSEMPPAFRSFLQKGFAELAVLPFEKVQKLSALVTSGFEPVDDVTVSESATLLNVPKEEVSKILGALSLLIAFTTRRTDVDIVLQQGSAAGAVPADHLPALLELAARLAERKAEYKEALEIASLAREVAPSLEGFDLTVELRFSFEDNLPTRSVPVVLCSLRTDSKKNRAFFQLRKQEVIKLIDQLSRAVRQVEALEKWAAK
jgi:hypothetical protein